MLSMTGYSSYLQETPRFTIQIDIKSINSKYKDLKINAGFCDNNYLEELRQIVLNRVYRGQVTVDLNLKVNKVDEFSNLNLEQLENYIQAVEHQYQEPIPRTFDNIKEFFVLGNLTQKNIYVFDEDTDGEIVKETLLRAIEAFYQSRLVEGNNLCLDFLDKTQQLLSICHSIEKKIPELERNFSTRLEKRMIELLETIDEIDKSRILNEVAIFATKTTVDEEIVRLHSHLKKLESLVKSDDIVIGKQIDFYMQEINREFNTIASKISDIDISKKIVDAKVLVDQIREQVQNII